jgi:hypothetical protein
LFDGRHILGNNLYAYCGNDPVNYVDSEGRYKVSQRSINSIKQDATNVMGVIFGRISGADFNRAVTDLYALNLVGQVVSDARYVYHYSNPVVPPPPEHSYTIALNWGGYGFFYLDRTAYLFTIPNYMMLIDANVENYKPIYDEVLSFMFILTNHVESWFGENWNNLKDLLNVFTPDDYVYLDPSEVNSLENIGTLGDWLITTSLKEFGNATVNFVYGLFNTGKDIKQSLEDSFYTIAHLSNNKDAPLIIWFDYQIVFGKTTKDFWKGFFKK